MSLDVNYETLDVNDEAGLLAKFIQLCDEVDVSHPVMALEGFRAALSCYSVKMSEQHIQVLLRPIDPCTKSQMSAL